jgi:fumarate hydratase, class II
MLASDLAFCDDGGYSQEKGKKHSMTRQESDSMGSIAIPKGALWGAQTQRSIKYFSISTEKMPPELIPAYALLKKACALANQDNHLLTPEKTTMIVTICDEILNGKHRKHFPLHVWMTGSGTQFNMNVNEVIANRAAQLKDLPLGQKYPLHPNDDINCSQSSNDNFPTAMHIASVMQIHAHLLPSLTSLTKALNEKSQAWANIIKIGRTHMQDATPLSLGQEFSGYTVLLEHAKENIESALKRVYECAIGGTAVGSGINAPPGFDKAVCGYLTDFTHLPFKAAANKFAVQGSHDALVFLSGALKTLAVSLHKIANDIRLLSCGPRAGFFELIIPANEPGSSIMPGKVNPTQCEALSMATIQVMANDMAVSLSGAGGLLEMNAYKTVMIHNILQSIRLLADSMHNFEHYLIKDTVPNQKKIQEYLEQSLMLVTALTPLIGYDKAAHLAHHAHANNMSLREATLELEFLTAEDFDAAIDPSKMIGGFPE